MIKPIHVPFITHILGISNDDTSIKDYLIEIGWADESIKIIPMLSASIDIPLPQGAKVAFDGKELEKLLEMEKQSMKHIFVTSYMLQLMVFPLRISVYVTTPNKLLVKHKNDINIDWLRMSTDSLSTIYIQEPIITKMDIPPLN